MRARFVVGVALGSALTACAASFPTDPEAQATFYLNEARKFISKGDCRSAGRKIDFALSQPTGKSKAQQLFEGSADSLDCYVSYINYLIEELPSPFYAFNTLERIEAAADAGILVADVERNLNENLTLEVLNRNKTGTLSFDLADNIEVFPELEVTENFSIIVERTISNLQDADYRENRTELTKSLMEYAQSIGIDSEVERIRSLLPTLNIRRGDLDIVAAVYPNFAENRLEEITARIFLQVKGGDRLLEEDLQNVLAQRVRGVEWVDSSGAEVIDLFIEQVRHSESTISEQTQNVTYARHQVNLISGALMMPNHSSYLYDLITGGVAIEYGYVITVKEEDAVIYDEIVRGNVNQEYSRCQNARIRNVFGGIKPANFVANRDMESRCNGPSSASLEELRRRVYSVVADEVLKVQPIESVHNLN
jgi:hypothetical protein